MVSIKISAKIEFVLQDYPKSIYYKSSLRQKNDKEQKLVNNGEWKRESR